MRFESAIDQHRHTQKKLDNDNRQSSPKLVTQLPIEIHGARVYTHELFHDFQQELISSTSGLSARGFSEKDGVEITTLKDGLSGKVFDIQFNPEVYEAVGLLRDRCKDDIQNLCSLILEFRQNLEPACEDLTKEHEIEQLLGCKAVDDIKILPPKQAKNKGSGRRLMSRKTLAVAKAVKLKCKCSNCKQMAHHDKRNCSNEFTEFPPSAHSPSSDEDGIDEEVEEEDESE
ncbi:hypothetical protein RND81_10G103200 [Saponaria officinalis]|uniref:Protein FAR1-RELATED SEQUENCE n=1 Tax=Saponaria officinalis TaxID=3572 RepID=A0AAW1I062_SAPOF